MSSTDENPNPDFSLSDNVRGFIQQAYDNSIDLTVKSNREEMIKQFKDNFPDQNPKTIHTLFSKEIPKIAKAYNVNPDEVKQKPSKKFTKDNEIKVNSKEQKSGVKTVSIQNQASIGTNGKLVTGTTPVYKYEIKSSQLASFSNAFYGMFQIFSEDLEDLTKEESADLGDLWQPVAQAKLGNSDRGQATLAIGGTFGIMARKAKKAKDNRKIRKQKESKERGTDLEKTKEIETAKGDKK